MKKFFALLFAAVTCFAAQAGELRATGMTMVDGFKLGLGIGVPGWNGDKAVMPMITVDGQWGLASGFINSKHFGNNGGVDLGFQYGICGYDHDMPGISGYYDARDCGLMEHLILFRSAFHYQFVKKLDTYLGFNGGVALSMPTGDWTEAEKDVWEVANGVFGMYSGGTWYFTDAFGAGIEFEGDWLHSHATPNISAKVSFKF